MFSTGGLALEQAPPPDLPARFFLTAPLFAAAAGLLIAWEGEALVISRWTPGAFAAAHLLAVGFLGQVMCGALLQILPVVAGSPVPRVRLVGTWVHLLLSLGGATLAWGLWAGGSTVLLLGGVITALGFLAFLVPVLASLIRARGAPHTVRAIRIAVGALAATTLLGLGLTGAVTGWIDLPGLALWVDAHAIMGLMGWVGLLIIGIAFQIVPMFYVTPPYAQRLALLMGPVIITAIGTGVLLWLLERKAGIILFGVAVAGFVLFAVTTMWLLSHPGRKRMDVTRLHWWLAMSAVCAAATAWVLDAPTPSIGVLLLVGVGVGLPTGMLLKIVPFLSWFHLQNRQLESGRLDVRIPYMRGFISERSAGFQLALHLGALTTLVAATLLPALALALARAGGLLLGLSALVLEGILLTAALRYQRAERSLTTPLVATQSETR